MVSEAGKGAAGAGAAGKGAGAPAITKIKSSGGDHVISGVHGLTDIGIPNNLKVSYEMQVTYEVLGQRNGVVLQYEEVVSAASDEICRAEKRYLQAFEVATPPQLRYLSPSQAHEQQEAGEEKFYSLLLVDPDYPSVQNPLFREHVHWVSAAVLCDV